MTYPHLGTTSPPQRPAGSGAEDKRGARTALTQPASPFTSSATQQTVALAAAPAASASAFAAAGAVRLSIDLRALAVGASPQHVARDVKHMIELSGVLARANSAWVPLLHSAIQASWSTLADDDKPRFVKQLLAFNWSPGDQVEAAYEATFRVLAALAARSASPATLDHALRRPMLDEHDLGTAFDLRALALRGYFGHRSPAVRTALALELVTEPLSPRLPAIHALELRVQALQALNASLADDFFRQLEGLACPSTEPERTHALLTRSPVYRLVPTQHDAVRDLSAQECHQVSIHARLASLVDALAAPLTVAELQGREAELIALGHQIDATPGPAYARLVALAEASAALPLPAPGHAGREQTLALRGRAIALLMQCRLNRRIAAFLEAPLPQSMPARRDSLDLRGAVWRTLSWHLPVAAKVAYWQNLTAYRSDFPEVADADRAALRQLLHASLALPTHPHTALESFYLRHKLEF